jgi:hypothetical protein
MPPNIRQAKSPDVQQNMSARGTRDPLIEHVNEGDVLRNIAPDSDNTLYEIAVYSDPNIVSYYATRCRSIATGKRQATYVATLHNLVHTITLRRRGFTPCGPDIHDRRYALVLVARRYKDPARKTWGKWIDEEDTP